MKPSEVKAIKQDFANDVRAEISKRGQRYIKTPVTWDTLSELMADVIDPKPEQPRESSIFPLPYIPPEYPKLKVLYSAPDYTAKEWLIVNNATEETLYRAGGWLTRPLSEVESLKANGVQERPLSEEDRRRDKFKYANP